MNKEVFRKIKCITAGLSCCLLSCSLLSSCQSAGEAALVEAAEPFSYVVTPRTTQVIRGDLVTEFSSRLDLLGLERTSYTFSYEEMNKLWDYNAELDALKVSVGDKVSAGDVLVSFHSEVLDQMIAENEEKIRSAQLEIDHYRRLAAIDKEKDYSGEIARLNREIEVERLYILDARDTYDDLNIVADRDGYISYINPTFMEGYFKAKDTLIVIDSSDGLYYLEKTDEYTFHSGEEVTAHLQDVEYPLVVIDTPEGKTDDYVYFQRTVDADTMPEKSLMLEFELPPLKDVVYVNRQAVYDKSGTYFVYQVDDKDIPHAVIVERGDKVGNYQIITSGLAGGENVELP